MENFEAHVAAILKSHVNDPASVYDLVYSEEVDKIFDEIIKCWSEEVNMGDMTTEQQIKLIEVATPIITRQLVAQIAHQIAEQSEDKNAFLEEILKDSV